MVSHVRNAPRFPLHVSRKGRKPDSVLDSHLSMRPIPAAFTPSHASGIGAATRATSRSLFGLAPDGVFRAHEIALAAVSSYLAFSPLPESCQLSAVSSQFLAFPANRYLTAES